MYFPFWDTTLVSDILEPPPDVTPYKNILGYLYSHKIFVVISSIFDQQKTLEEGEYWPVRDAILGGGPSSVYLCPQANKPALRGNDWNTHKPLSFFGWCQADLSGLGGGLHPNPSPSPKQASLRGRKPIWQARNGRRRRDHSWNQQGGVKGLELIGLVQPREKGTGRAFKMASMVEVKAAFSKLQGFLDTKLTTAQKAHMIVDPIMSENSLCKLTRVVKVKMFVI
ncbi:hypothetical protein B0H16DRAFT_1468931 [Mycena metata]|uniref:Uncharacterized protein n=1 Tax=Mycena metata TaxID=1033252 RepID=A0AAD7I106_9AGAR|nr:hypothetical protein B0H16DRAFT_1468931 [Mycena metata]